MGNKKSREKAAEARILGRKEDKERMENKT